MKDTFSVLAKIRRRQKFQEVCKKNVYAKHIPSNLNSIDAHKIIEKNYFHF